MTKIIFFLLAVLCYGSAGAQDTPTIKYRRSSIYTLMVDNTGEPYADDIKRYFEKSPLPEKFNDNNLTSRTIVNWPAGVKKEDDVAALFAAADVNNPAYVALQAELNGIARAQVAKWFNRSAKGGFNMELVKTRGSYDASAMDIVTAKASKRGLDLLADAGEELIGKTFVLVNDFKYISKEEVAAKAKSWLAVAGAVVPGASTVTSATSSVTDVMGKGYVVKTTAHLFQLVWDEETAAVFYNDYWADDATITPEKKKAFDEASIFKLKYIGSDNSWADVQSTIYTSKSETELVEKATIKAIDAVIVKLQKEYDTFKTKTPLFSGEPITAKIGMKEGVTEKTKFEVLEQQVDENGKTQYVVVGTVKVDDKFPIWDNRYGADIENADASNVGKTYFKKVSGKDFYAGMLIIQKKGK
jgi:hypothetical protein